MDLRLVSLTVVSLIFALLNGANDAGTIAASVVSSRAFSPRRAVFLAALSALAGALLMGSNVARTFGRGLIDLNAVPASADPFLACLAAATAVLLWNGLGWRLGLPGSYTHALLGSWLGAFCALAGPGAVRWRLAAGVLGGVLLAPPVCLFVSWIAMRLLYRLAENLSMHAMVLVRAAERATFLAVSFAHGANAAQTSMALLAFGSLMLKTWPVPDGFFIPLGARVACAGFFAFGILAGFTRVLKTVGFRIFNVGPLQSACALGSAGALLLVSTLAGLPLSAGQVNSSSLMGAGAGTNARAVRWGVAHDMLTHWALTFPVSALLAFLLVKFIK